MGHICWPGCFGHLFHEGRGVQVDEVCVGRAKLHLLHFRPPVLDLGSFALHQRQVFGMTLQPLAHAGAIPSVIKLRANDRLPAGGDSLVTQPPIADGSETHRHAAAGKVRRVFDRDRRHPQRGLDRDILAIRPRQQPSHTDMTFKELHHAVVGAVGDATGRCHFAILGVAPRDEDAAADGDFRRSHQ